MTAMTLQQLKDENAADDTTEATLTPEVEEVETEAAAEETEVEAEQSGETSEEETKEEPAESWMQTEGQTSEAGSKKPSYGGLKRKLKARIGEKDDEINVLRQEIEALKLGTQTQPQAKPESAPRPTREQYDFNDDKYDEAVDAWNDARNDARIDAKLAGHVQQQVNTQSADAQKRDLSAAVDRHYEKAQELVDTGVISDTDYLKADSMVRGALEQLNPGKGDAIADLMISRLARLGEGGEKVWFSLRDSNKLQALVGKMRDDPSGLDAMAYLGKLQTEVTMSPSKRVSRAPKPGSSVQGDSSLSSSSEALHKRYKKADNDVQARITLKRQAKAAGVDTSKW